MVLLKSIKSQLSMLLVVQFVVLIGLVSTSVYLVNLRQHDYLILNLAGQLRVIAQGVTQHSNHYLYSLSDRQATSAREHERYLSYLDAQLNNFGNIIASLEQRTIAAELLDGGYVTQSNPFRAVSAKVALIDPQSTKLVCKWNPSARSQMKKTAATWHRYENKLKRLMKSYTLEADYEQVASYVVLNEEILLRTTKNLAQTFQSMMQDKLTEIRRLNQLAILTIIVISLTILFIIYKRIFRPIDIAVKGFERVALGELSHQIDYQSHNEIGVMTKTFNHLTRRISNMFRLTNELTKSTTLDKTLETVYQAFPQVLPVDWVGILRRTQDPTIYTVEREYSEQQHVVPVFNSYPAEDTVFQQVEQSQVPYCWDIKTKQAKTWDKDRFMQDLTQAGFASMFFMPITNSHQDTAILVLATKQQNAYHQDDIDFVKNLAVQVQHSFEATTGMETLVISAVKGLAKLAESRDPETGDHLFRMSHYSAYIAEALANTDKYREIITPSYVRQIFQFAPMHDIGKVGVSDAILLKPGALTKEEFAQMQVHPSVGADVLRRCEQEMNKVGRSVFQIGIEIAEGHHEKYDGNGYPNQLSGEAIPLSARIIAVGDVFDALTSKRPYKEAWPVDKAIALIHEEAGKHFDPDVVAAFDDCLDKIMAIYDQYKHV